MMTMSEFDVSAVDLSGVLKNHLRKVPELAFFLDDSLDYIESVEDSIQNPENPIKG